MRFRRRDDLVVGHFAMGVVNQSRVVLVTGGSRGIGLGCARALAAQGHRVALTYRTNPPPEEGFLSIAADSADPESAEAVFGRIEEELGPVEILVANAGFTRDTLLARMSEQDWDTVLEANLSGSWRYAKRASRQMMRNRWGRIIFMSSVVALSGAAGQANYAASKAAMIGLGRSMARELASRQVTVNIVAPGAVDTELLAAAGEQRVAEIRKSIPLGRLASPEEIAAAVAFLASAEASYITGVVLGVDGGLGMGH